MRINHNIMALNAYRQLSVNNVGVQNLWRNCHPVSESIVLVMMPQDSLFPEDERPDSGFGAGEP